MGSSVSRRVLQSPTGACGVTQKPLQPVVTPQGLLGQQTLQKNSVHF